MSSVLNNHKTLEDYDKLYNFRLEHWVTLHA